MSKPPRILAIAGSDSSGGAGIQADIKTITMLGGYAMTAITAVTAQNTLGVTAVEVLAPELVAAQIDACMSDIGVDAIKIGMLGSPEVAAIVADRLESLDIPIVFDPVMIATSGAELADAETIAGFERLMKIATVTTPNLPELASLSGFERVQDEFEMADAAEAVMVRTGAPAILAKGGHWPGGFVGSQSSSVRTDDLLFDCLYCLSDSNWNQWEFHHPKVITQHTHGTGCTLSSAIATELGRGAELPDAVRSAGNFVHAALVAAPGFGQGSGPLGHAAVRDQPSRS